MAEQVIFGKMSKRLNSTKSSMTNVKTTSVVLKEPTSIEAPTFIIQETFDNIRTCNYCKWASNCYWIDDIVSTAHNIVEVHCHRDPLATFKSYIKNSGAYVRYASDPMYSLGVDDWRLSPTAEVEYNEFSLINPDFIDFTEGTVVLSVYAWDGTSGGKFDYAMPFSEYLTLLRELNSFLMTNFDSLSDILDLFSNSFVKLGTSGSWKDNIISAIWIPIKFSKYPGTDTNQIWIGGYSNHGNYKLLGHIELLEDTTTIRITHPWFPTYGVGNHNENAVMALPRFTQGSLVHPCGITDINMLPLARDYSGVMISRKFSISYVTGEYCIRLETDSTGGSGSIILAEVYGNLSIDVMNYNTSGSNFIGGLMLPAMMKSTITAASALAGGFNLMTTTPAHTVYNTTDTKKSFDAAGDLTGITSHRETVTEVPEQHGIGSGISGAFGAGGSTPTSVISANGAGYASYGFYLSEPEKMFTIRLVTYIPELILSHTYEDFCEKNGYVVEQYKSTLPDGYVQCSNASCAAPATVSELSTINSYLNSGIYIE